MGAITFILREKMESPHIPDDNEYEVPDFCQAPFGLLVIHSDHYYRERGMKIPKQKQMGIVVDTKFYQDSKGRIVCWPIVAWEGAVVSSMTHPMNVVPYRKKQTLPMRKMDNGQWGTNGPGNVPT